MSRKLTIGYVLDDTLDVPDGVQQAMILIGETMRGRGHDVHYITSTTTRDDLNNVHVLARNFGLRFNGNTVRTPLPASHRAVKRLFAETAFDILHLQMPYSPLLAARVIKAAPSSTKVFGTFHILPYGRLSRLGTRALSWLLASSRRRIDVAYATSQPAADFMSSHFGLSGSPLPNPVRYGFFKSAKAFNKKVKHPSIVFVGRFDERKGVRQLVKAYELLVDQRVQATLTTCGKGPLLEELKEYAGSRNLGIEFTGFVTEEEKAARLKAADIAIFPSTGGESFGIVLTEAMSAGAAVTLGGDNPGYASVLGEWPETLFDGRSPEAIADVIKKFLQDNKLRERTGKQQHEAVKRYDIEVIADSLEKDYLAEKNQ